MKRSDFDKPIGMILEAAAQFSPEDTQKILQAQAQYQALSDAKKLATPAPRPSELDALIAQHGLQAQAATALEELKKPEKTFRVSRDVPLFGMIAADLKLVSAEQKNATLLAQAAERTAQVGEGKANPKSGIPLKDGKLDIGDKMFSRDFIGQARKDGSKDPDALIQAQAVEHLSALLQGAVSATPDALSDKQLQTARAALTTLGADLYKKAAGEMKASGLKDEAVQVAGHAATELKATPAMTRNQALLALHDALEAAKTHLPPEQQAAFAKVVEAREAQIKMDFSTSGLARDVEKLNDTRSSNDRAALDDAKKQFGLAGDTPKGFLQSGASADLTLKLAEVAQGGVTLAEMGKVRTAFAAATQAVVERGDSGVGLSGGEIKGAISSIKSSSGQGR